MAQEKTVLVLGDGPTGLSAALFLAKNGFEAPPSPSTSSRASAVSRAETPPARSRPSGL